MNNHTDEQTTFAEKDVLYVLDKGVSSFEKFLICQKTGFIDTINPHPLDYISKDYYFRDKSREILTILIRLYESPLTTPEDKAEIGAWILPPKIMLKSGYEIL